MRRLTIELKVKEEFLEMLNFLLDKTESIELIELIKIDFEQGVKMGIAALNMKEGYTIEDLDFPEYMDMLAVLKKEGNRYIVFSKVTYLKKFTNLAKKFNLDIIWDTPSLFTKDKTVISVIGNEENLKKILEVIKNLGEIKSISFSKAAFNEQTILSCLTEKQKEILIAAKKNGYYKYPRKINSQQLSEKVGLSKPTVVQHLRKAEIRLISNILTGY
ncbi:MAG: helix-turn-helix domain-containing protein [Candidatus Thermoplasmatota archaeon]|nr:helix-turn-helix domain-containing protein [Candidatus Thermoplasmatota archaeon]MBU1940347.1 helix-turn-helix domain-containing protein [Candidatus Thermoplasmatota archaeon]